MSRINYAVLTPAGDVKYIFWPLTLFLRGWCAAWSKWLLASPEKRNTKYTFQHWLNFRECGKETGLDCRNGREGQGRLADRNVAM